jgi:2-desacetyl-2-hydroxyethyl bacteriochlorophyllide A dehydrogenase
MKAAVFTGIKQIEIRDITLPPPGPGEALVRNMAAGVCGTDVHIYHGEPGSAEVTPPVILGHEYAGVVEALGEGVKNVAAGDRVTVDPNIYCGLCAYCRRGSKQMCEDMKAVGVTQDGGFAEYSLVPASQLLKVSPQADIEAAAMAEPLACCIHGIDLAGIKAGDSVLVIGGGAIGLLMLQLARQAGAAFVALSEPVAMRRAAALELGADAVIDPFSENPAERIAALTGREGAEVVIECVGNTAATRQAFDCAGKGATVLLFSVPGVEAVFPLPLFDVFKKELTIKGSFVNPDTQSRAVALINAGRINVGPIITHRYPVEQTEEAIRMQMSPESIKVLVVGDTKP